MAKLNEGDERWIVKDLGEKGKNSELSMDDWTKDKFSQVFKDFLVINKDKLVCKVTSVDTRAEVTIFNRKGKLKSLYEIKLKMNWEGEMKDQENKKIGSVEKGEIIVTDIDQDQEIDDFQVKLTPLKDSNEISERIFRIMEKQGLPVIKETIVKLVEEIKKGAKFANENVDLTSPSPTKKVETQPFIEKKEETKNKSIDIVITEEFKAPPSEIFECLLDTNRVQVYTRSGAKVSKIPGESFVLFNGNVHGENVEIIQNKKIVQKWRFKDWKEGHFSELTIELSGEGKTKLKLTQKNVPENEKQRVEHGWKEIIFSGIQKIFNF